MVQLGDKVKDSVSGFSGICYGITKYLNGCTSIGIKSDSLKPDGTKKDLEWVDEQDIEVVSSGFSLFKKRTGGPMPTPKTEYGGRK